MIPKQRVNLKQTESRSGLPTAWWNQETLKNTSRDTTLKRNNKKQNLEIEMQQLQTKSSQVCSVFKLQVEGTW